ncbi:MAG: HEAT repeat domain-containing protein [Candidatus Heimdallarchaeota archaeon]|nr:HEAT repeat domain-containing protein [Candidatus Heimdallarchaeota archaeon]
MEQELAKMMKKFKNSPDFAKFELLDKLGNEQKSQNLVDFLIQISESDKYYKIRIKAVMTVKKFEDSEIAQKLSELYAYERDRNVRLAITESLGDMSTSNTDEMLLNIAKNDLNDVVRSAALRKLHERKKLKKVEMRKLILETIKNDHDVYPRQIALSIIPKYANQTVYASLKTIFDEETKFKMRSLLYKTLVEIATKLDKEIDVDEPVKPKEEPIKKRKRRKKKKDREAEEHLFF